MWKITKIIIVAVAIILVTGFIFWDVPRNRVEMFLERAAIEKSAHAYLKAEMEGNSQQVYAFLAPSSTYKQTHSYEEFIKDIAGYPPMAINTYKIIRIYRLRDNDNRKNYPGVDKLVQVEVEVTFTHAGPDSIFNYSFTFLKEKGNWYKG
jgi:hypothetical protein